LNEIKLIEKLEITSINKEQLTKIKKRLPEYHRVKKIIGHSRSQAQYTLLTLQMITDSPYSRMKQCISQIHHKFEAVSEAYYDIEKKKDNLKNLSEIEKRETESIIISLQDSMGNSLRELGMFQDFYESIRINNKIPVNWNESDYEKQEIANMVRHSFRLGVQELSAHATVSKSAVEYWEQLGIHPQIAETECRKYLIMVHDMITKDKEVTIKIMYEFLDAMAFKFKDSYKFALDRIGLKELGSEDFRASN